jgi:hypothetical protein
LNRARSGKILPMTWSVEGSHVCLCSYETIFQESADKLKLKKQNHRNGQLRRSTYVVMYWFARINYFVLLKVFSSQKLSHLQHSWSRFTCIIAFLYLPWNLTWYCDTITPMQMRWPLCPWCFWKIAQNLSKSTHM